MTLFTSTVACCIGSKGGTGSCMRQHRGNGGSIDVLPATRNPTLVLVVMIWGRISESSGRKRQIEGAQDAKAPPSPTSDHPRIMTSTQFSQSRCLAALIDAFTPCFLLILCFFISFHVHSRPIQSHALTVSLVASRHISPTLVGPADLDWQPRRSSMTREQDAKKRDS